MLSSLSFFGLAVSGSSDSYIFKPPTWPLYTPTLYKVYLQQTPAVQAKLTATTRVKVGFRCAEFLNLDEVGRDFALLGRTMPITVGKVTEEKETSVPIPKKYF